MVVKEKSTFVNSLFQYKIIILNFLHAYKNSIGNLYKNTILNDCILRFTFHKCKAESDLVWLKIPPPPKLIINC